MSTVEQQRELIRAERRLAGEGEVTGLQVHDVAAAFTAFGRVRVRFTGDAGQRDGAPARVDAVYASWRAANGVAGDGWGENVPDASPPPADKAWQMVGAARIAAGRDPVTREALS